MTQATMRATKRRENKGVRRKGSPWTGIWTVVAKEMADHFSSARMKLLQGLILLTAIGTVYTASQSLKDARDTQFLFLRLFTTASEPLPSFVSFLGFLIPIIAIALGFDAINSEFNKRTLSRLLSQPIYRDALLLGKFLGALFTIAITLLALWLLVTGMGIFFLGIPPTGEEVVRGLLFLFVTLAYAGVWLVLAMMFSVIFKQPATSALAALAVWLLFAVFWPIIVGVLTPLYPSGNDPFATQLGQARFEQTLNRVSPNTLFSEATIALLNPATRSLGPIFFSQLQGAIIGAPLPLGQSVLLIWPHLTGLIAAVILLFALSYVLFQRQEIRA
jgi:ABC-2 type transport system permease protein